MLRNRVLTAFGYSGVCRDLVHRMKFYGREDIAEKFGMEAAARLYHSLESYNPNMVIPVPLHPVRIRERGYDQNRTIAAAVANRLGVPLRTDLIHRIRNTPPQSRLSDKQRLSNLDKAIVPVGDSATYSGQKALLVDDVVHTGATLKSCMEALMLCDIGEVMALAVCG
jgi:ComF family protein